MSKAQGLPIELRLRPTRIALLVDPQDEGGISRWMRLTTMLWGGPLNPIIPVSDQVPAPWRDSAGTEDGFAMALAYLRFFQPDVLVEGQPGLAARLLKSNPTGQPWGHVIALDDFANARHGVAAGLLADHAYTARYRREAQFVLREPVTWILPEADDLGFAELAWGVFPSDPRLSYVERTYREAFKPQLVRPTPAAWLQHYGENRASPLAASFEGLEILPSTNAAARLFVFDPASTLDRIDVWNSRLFWPGVLPVPIDWVPALADVMCRLAREGRPSHPGDFYGQPEAMVVEFSETLLRARAEALVATHLTDAEGPPLLSFNYPRPTLREGEREDAPRLHRISGGVRSSKLALNADGHGQIASVAPAFETADAMGDHLWANVLTFGHQTFDSMTATVFPTNDLDRGFPRLHGVWGQTVVNREGLVFFPHNPTAELYLRLPDQREALTDWLGRQGVSAEPSGAGRIAEEMLRALGGPWGAALISEKPVLDLLNKMAVSEDVRVDPDGRSVARRFDGKTAGLTQWRNLIHQMKGQTEYRFEQSDFVERNVLRLGLNAACGYCGQANWYPLDRLGYELPCERCLRTFPVPEAITRPEAWRYRVIGSFAVPNYADGAYAVALTLRFLTLLVNYDVETSYATATELSWDGKTIETDFLLWWRVRRDKINDPPTRLVLGEAKSFATRAIDAKTIENLTAMAQRFPDAVLVVAKLAEAYAPEERALLREFRNRCRDAGHGTLLIVLTGRELLARAGLVERWSAGSDRQKELAETLRNATLEALAEASCEVYLGARGA
jgi:hypothetical protein